MRCSETKPTTGKQSKTIVTSTRLSSKRTRQFSKNRWTKSRCRCRKRVYLMSRGLLTRPCLTSSENKRFPLSLSSQLWRKAKARFSECTFGLSMNLKTKTCIPCKALPWLSSETFIAMIYTIRAWKSWTTKSPTSRCCAETRKNKTTWYIFWWQGDTSFASTSMKNGTTANLWRKRRDQSSKNASNTSQNTARAEMTCDYHTLILNSKQL